MTPQSSVNFPKVDLKRPLNSGKQYKKRVMRAVFALLYSGSIGDLLSTGVDKSQATGGLRGVCTDRAAQHNVPVALKCVSLIRHLPLILRCVEDGLLEIQCLRLGPGNFQVSISFHEIAQKREQSMHFLA